MGNFALVFPPCPFYLPSFMGWLVEVLQTFKALGTWLTQMADKTQFGVIDFEAYQAFPKVVEVFECQGVEVVHIRLVGRFSLPGDVVVEDDLHRFAQLGCISISKHRSMKPRQNNSSKSLNSVVLHMTLLCALYGFLVSCRRFKNECSNIFMLVGRRN